MDIYLIRHGQSTGNGRNCFMGWSDHPLTDLGRAQAEAAAGRLAALGPMPVLCSDLQRARQTAEIVAARWDVEVLADCRWREICCGDFEDRPWDAFSCDPELQARFESDPYHTVMPGGESAAMMAARALAAFDEVLAQENERVVIVTHDGPIRAVLAHCLGIPDDRFWRYYTDHGGYTHLTCLDGWLAVRTMNDISHWG
jgi:broad specificity phosphatase PhoE